MGSPAAALPCLAALTDIADVAVVVTRPDQPKGRGRRSGPSPVKVAAREWGYPVAEPDSDHALVAALEGLEIDVAVVVAYGRILKRELLEVPRAGAVNVHFSLLPRWRGAAPVERAILADDEITGVSLMLIDEGLDTGPVISAHETEIRQHETAGDLTARLAHMGADLLHDVLPDFLSGKRQPAPQISAGVTIARQLTTDEARLDPRESAGRLNCAVRAFNPRPGAWLLTTTSRLKVLEVAAADVDVEVGTIRFAAGRPFLGAEDAALELLRVQPEGKRAMAGDEWARGVHAAELKIELPV